MSLFGSFRVFSRDTVVPDWIKKVTSTFGYLDAEQQSKDVGVALSDKEKLLPSVGENGDVIGAQFYGNMRRYINYEEPTKPQKLRVYRQMADYPEVKYALNLMVHELINHDDFDGNVGKLLIKNKELIDNINKKDNLHKEWNYVFNDLLNFKDTAYDAILSFLISGELIYEKIISPDKKHQGLKRIKRLKPDNVFPIWKTDLDEVEYFRIKDIRNLSYENSIPRSQLSYAYWDCFLQNMDTGEIYVVSYLEPVKKTWRQLMLLEEALVIYRVVRAPERRIFKIATGNMPKHQAEAYIQKLMRLYRQKKIYNTSTGEINGQNNIMAMLEDYWIANPADGNASEIDTLPGGCLTLDTKIPLLDGRTLELKDIIKEHKEGKKNWTYSCNPETGEIVPGPITAASITNENAEVMKITLDNGKEVTCTLNHKWPTWNKGTVEAKDLEVGDSFIPFNKKFEKIKNADNEYEMVYDNKNKKWKYTHRIVAEYFKNINQHNTKIHEQIYDDYKTVHHLDFNRFNNLPNNLYWMDAKDHYKMHSKLFGKQGKLGSLKHNELMKNDKEYREKWIRNCIIGKQNMSEIDKIKMSKKISMKVKNYINNLSEEEKQNRRQNSINARIIASKKFNEKMKSDLNFRQIVLNKRGKSISLTKSKEENRIKLSELMKNRHKNKDYTRKIFELQTVKFNNEMLKIAVDCCKKSGEKYKDLLCMLNNNENFKDVFNKENNSVKRFKTFQYHHLRKLLKQFNYEGWNDFRKNKELFNHKIVKIERLEERQVVANLTIDGDEKYHNFHTYALDIGVFTKNSTLGEIDDINYFLEKLYRALEIPVNRRLEHYSGDQKYNIGNITDISWQEVKFTKMVNRVRRKVVNVLFDLYKTHLKLKGLWDQYNLKNSDFQIELNRNNFFEELKRAQLEETRLNAWGTVSTYIGDVFSKEMAIKHFLKWSDEEYEMNKQLLAKEGGEGVEGGGGAPLK